MFYDVHGYFIDTHKLLEFPKACSINFTMKKLPNLGFKRVKHLTWTRCKSSDYIVIYVLFSLFFGHNYFATV